MIWYPYHAKIKLPNGFLSYNFIINVPSNDYEKLCSLFNIPLLSSQNILIYVNFLSVLLNGSLDTPELLVCVQLKFFFYLSLDQYLFTLFTIL